MSIYRLNKRKIITLDSVWVRLGRFPRGKFQVQITRCSTLIIVAQRI